MLVFGVGLLVELLMVSGVEVVWAGIGFSLFDRAGLMLAAMQLPLFFVVPSSQDGMTAAKCSVYSSSCSARSFVVNKLYRPLFSERVSLSTGEFS